MTTVYHPNVNTVVPWQANYTYPSQATQIQKQTVKIQPMGSQSITGATGTKITFQLPSDGYLNTRNSAFSFALRVYGVHMMKAYIKVATESGPATKFYVADEVNPQGIAVTTADALNGYYVVLVSGPFAGQVLKIQDHLADRGVTFFSGNVDGIGDPVDGGFVNAAINSKHECIVTDNLVSLAAAGIHSLFKRVVIRYGGLVLEDIQEYAKLAQLLLVSGAAPDWATGVGAICDGTSGSGATTHSQDTLLVYSSSNMDYQPGKAQTYQWTPKGSGSGAYIERRFTFNLFAGLTTAQKLLPLKWMAAQFRIELELAPYDEAFIQSNFTMLPNESSATGRTGLNYDTNLTTRLSYTIEQPVYIAELMEFDSLYDTAFYAGMQQMGVPIKFTSWHHQSRSVPGDGTQHLPLSESARSMKAAFAVLTDTTAYPHAEFLTFYHNVGAIRSTTATAVGKLSEATVNPVQEFQWRIGGRYAPAQPVDCTSGGSEAFLELSKAINSLGDYTFSQRIQPKEWSCEVSANPGRGQKFIMAQEFENTDVFPNTISGINAENQSDLMLKVSFAGTGYTAGSKNLQTFISFDNLLILREGHLVDLVM